MIDKYYGSLLGMNMGIRLGAPVEPEIWTSERIIKVFGDLRSYTKEYKNFAADDDMNGPAFFIRSMYDKQDEELIANDVADAWLNYSREGIGMFWWGGDQISTEHTAFNNLLKGIKAPMSGSCKQNGLILSEQIGGQIFIDTWGLIFAGDPVKAATYAAKAALVAHDGNGVEGAKFIAACIANAFILDNVYDIVIESLKQLDSNNLYYAVVMDVVEYFNANKTWQEALEMLHQKWGYDKYTGVCHIIPNAGVCAIALLYSNNSTSRSIEIATMCGWDTDCNAGNVGSVLGALEGASKLEMHYRIPMNDNIITSSIIGYKNIFDLPTFSKELFDISKQYQNKGKVVDNQSRYLDFDFELHGSTHGFRTSDAFMGSIKNANVNSSENALEVMIDRIHPNDEFRVYYKPFYRRDDFNDERYKPVFAPQIHSGNIINFEYTYENWNNCEIEIQGYVRNTSTKEIIKLPLTKNGLEVFFEVPNLNGMFVDEVGLVINSPMTLGTRATGRLLITHFYVSGKDKYAINFAKQAIEFKQVLPFAHNLGSHYLMDKCLYFDIDTYSQSFTGNYYLKDSVIIYRFNVTSGTSFGFYTRMKGVYNGNFISFSANEVQVFEVGRELELKKSVGCSFEFNKVHTVTVKTYGDKLEVSLNNELVLEYQGLKNSSGMYGYGGYVQASGRIELIEVEEL